MGQDKDTNFFFSDKEAAVPPSYLCKRIIDHIRIEKKLVAARKRAVYFSFALAGSTVAFLFAFFTFGGALIRSELFKLVSLLLSDPAAIATNWADFGSFFLESLPLAYLIIFLSAVFALLWSLRYAAKYASETFALSKAAKNN